MTGEFISFNIKQNSLVKKKRQKKRPPLGLGGGVEEYVMKRLRDYWKG